jgi:hypothetical protein
VWQGLQRAVASGGAIRVPTNVHDKLRRLQPGDLEGMTDRERVQLAAAAAAALQVASLDAPVGNADSSALLGLIAG